MIYIDVDKSISNCVICDARCLTSCHCETLEVYVYEMIIFWDFEGTPEEFSDQNNPKFKRYQEKNKNLELNIRKSFPNAKKLIYYPEVYTK